MNNDWDGNQSDAMLGGQGSQSRPKGPGNQSNNETLKLTEEDPLAALSAPSPLILRCKIVLLGDTTVGKTSIAQVFCGGMQQFPKNYAMTIGVDFMTKRVSIPETNIVVEMYVVDCGGFSVSPECMECNGSGKSSSDKCRKCDGSGRVEDLLKPHWENASAVMLVYDISNPDSFANLASWYDRIKQCRPDSVITGVVIASKTDLGGRTGSVTTEQGQNFSKETGLQFFECCASKGIVDVPFHFLAEVFHSKYADRLQELDRL